MQARIAWLVRDDEEILRAKRRRLEEFLWAVHETNYADYWWTDGDGRERLRPFSALSHDQQQLIESLKFTEKGRPILSVYSKMQANIELRKLNGIGAVTRDGDDDLSRMSNDELRSELGRMARKVGRELMIGMQEAYAGE